MCVLVLTNAKDATADYLCTQMRDAGVRYIRLDTESFASSASLTASTSAQVLTVGDHHLTPAEVTTVWYRRPKALVGTIVDRDTRAAAFTAMEWTAALEGFLSHVPRPRWMNHPASIVGASMKLEQLSRARVCGLAVPDWCCTSSREDALQFTREHDGRVVAKPLYSGYIERPAPGRDSVIYTSPVHIKELKECGPHLGAPTLFQQELVDAIDVRITWVDDDAIAMQMTREGGGVDIRRDNMRNVRYAPVNVPPPEKESLRALIRAYDLRFAAIDMMVTRDRWQFLEVNPNGQWAWLDLMGGADCYRLFLDAFRGKAGV